MGIRAPAMSVTDSNGAAPRRKLPTARDRRPLGVSGLTVSPICIGLTGSPDVIPAAYDRGVNFFFLTADLHWPLYEGLRQGLMQLLARGGGVRDDIVVALVSYLDEPLFHYLQVHEVFDAVAGLQRADVLLAGAVSSATSFNERFAALVAARSVGHGGMRAIGASFHDRPTARDAINLDCIDASFIRFNAAHPGAAQDIFPQLRPRRRSLIYNFTSVLGMVTQEQFTALGLDGRYYLPRATDYYRYVLTSEAVDGILCAPRTVGQLEEMLTALELGALTPEEVTYMTWLSTTAVPRYFQ